MGGEQVIKVFAVGRGNQFAELKASPEGAAIVAPTWTPAQFERNLNTRAAASSLERRQRTMQVCPSHPNMSQNGSVHGIEEERDGRQLLAWEEGGFWEEVYIQRYLEVTQAI